MRKKILNALFIIFVVAIIGYCGYQIITTLQERYLSNQEYVTTREHYVSAIHEKEEVEEEPEKEEAEDSAFPKLRVDVNGLLKVNPDYAAWLYYKDADISYPITQSTISDEDRYLTTTFEGNKNPSGCVFMDYNADDAFRYNNTFLYGHNMANGTMFGSLKKVYQNPKDATDPYFYIYTKYGKVNQYRVFAVYITDETDTKAYSIPATDEDYDKYVATAMKHGSFTAYVPFTDAEREAIELRNPIVTLSTCYGRAGTTKRLLVQGVYIKSENYSTEN